AEKAKQCQRGGTREATGGIAGKIRRSLLVRKRNSRSRKRLAIELAERPGADGRLAPKLLHRESWLQKKKLMSWGSRLHLASCQHQRENEGLVSCGVARIFPHAAQRELNRSRVLTVCEIGHTGNAAVGAYQRVIR